MTAYIDNITIVGTPEEIQRFIELRSTTYTGAGAIDITTDGTVVQGNWEFSNGKPDFIPEHVYFQNDNVDLNPSG